MTAIVVSTGSITTTIIIHFNFVKGVLEFIESERERERENFY